MLLLGLGLDCSQMVTALGRLLGGLVDSLMLGPLVSLVASVLWVLSVLCVGWVVP